MKRADVIENLLLSRKAALHLFYITQQFGIQITTDNFDIVTVVEDEPEVLREIELWADDVGLLSRKHPEEAKLLFLEVPKK
jgi:hypothetical protein